MSRSSASDARRGQVQPIPALVAVLALTLALTAYADVTPPEPSPVDSSAATSALKRVEHEATTGAVLRPAAIDPAAARLPAYRVNVTLAAPATDLALGPRAPSRATAASARVAVSTDGRVVPGVLRVEVWPWAAA